MYGCMHEIYWEQTEQTDKTVCKIHGLAFNEDIVKTPFYS